MIEIGHGKRMNAELAWSEYPTCSGLVSNGTAEERYGLVYGDLFSSKPEEKVAALHLAFGPAFWVAILIHVAATELYLRRNGGKEVEGERLTGGMEKLTRSEKDKGVKGR